MTGAHAGAMVLEVVLVASTAGVVEAGTGGGVWVVVVSGLTHVAATTLHTALVHRQPAH